MMNFSLGGLLVTAVITGLISSIIAGEVVRIKGGTTQQIIDAQWTWFWRGAVVGAIVYGTVWTIHTIWLWLVGGGAVTAQQSAQYGYETHDDLIDAWREIGYPSDYHIHHFVQQTIQNINNFGKEAIHSLKNTWPVDPQVHNVITSYQNSSSSTVGLEGQIGYVSRMYQYIQQLPWEEQYEWGRTLYDYVVQNSTWQGFTPP